MFGYVLAGMEGKHGVKIHKNSVTVWTSPRELDG